MKKKNIIIFFGTRPEIIKLLPLIQLIEKNKNKFNLILCSTGQHATLTKNLINFFNLNINYNLKIMKKNQSLTYLNSKMISKISQVLLKTKPDIAIVHGDTTTTFSAALTCFYNKIKIFHIEAGLRTFDILSPFPEEFNRQMVTKIAYKHFAPTNLNKKNLLKENVDPKKIFVTGNTSIDAINIVTKKIDNSQFLKDSINRFIKKNIKIIDNKKKLVLITVHRRENFGEPLKEIFKSLKYLSSKYKNINFVYPVHPNPNVKLLAEKTLSNIHNVFLTKPLDYYVFIYLLKNSYFVITDSGGLQEEAPYLGKPVILLRYKTERPEILGSGNTEIVGSKYNSIVKIARKLIDSKAFYAQKSKKSFIYGSGNSSKLILKHLI